jgi:dTDP-4-amino-4,6-dideoxygalactose transaminase
MDNKTFPAWPQLDADDYEMVKGVLDSGQLWCGAPQSPCGHNVWEFQKEFADFQQARHCIAVTNGTHAIEVALLGLDVGLGDEVIVSDYTFVASASAVMAVNAVPIFCDINSLTHNMDETKIEPLITPRTRAIVAVHLGGMPNNMDAILQIARKHDLRVIEDCAHSHGSKYRGKRAGNWGDCGTFSFQASKLLASGEGGAVVCNDDQLAEKFYSVSDCGRLPGHYFYAHYRYGSNYRLGEFQAAVLRSQLKNLSGWQHALRNRNADYLRKCLDSIEGIRCQQKIDGVEEVGQYVFPVSFDPARFNNISREEFCRKLREQQIPLADCYPPLHSLVCFRETKGLKGIDYSLANWGGTKSDDRNFPVVSEVYRRSFQFPQQMLLVQDQNLLNYVAEVIEGIKAGRI